MTYSMANIMGPYFSLNIAEKHGFDTLWYISGALCVLTFGGFMLMKKRNPDPVEHAPVQQQELVPVPSGQTS